jgi:hypothetical protein
MWKIQIFTQRQYKKSHENKTGFPSGLAFVARLPKSSFRKAQLPAAQLIVYSFTPSAK